MPFRDLPPHTPLTHFVRSKSSSLAYPLAFVSIKGSLVYETSVLRTFKNQSYITHHTPLINTPLIIHHSSIHHSSYTTPLIIHHSIHHSSYTTHQYTTHQYTTHQYTTHHTPLIKHHSSYTTHHTPLIIHHSSPS